jgi:hypothetical protein
MTSLTYQTYFYILKLLSSLKYNLEYDYICLDAAILAAILFYAN